MKLKLINADNDKPVEVETEDIEYICEHEGEYPYTTIIEGKNKSGNYTVKDRISEMFKLAFQLGYRECANNTEVVKSEIFQEGYEAGKKIAGMKDDKLPKGWFETIQDTDIEGAIVRRAINAKEVHFVRECEEHVDIVFNTCTTCTKEPYEEVMRKLVEALNG